MRASLLAGGALMAMVLHGTALAQQTPNAGRDAVPTPSSEDNPNPSPAPAPVDANRPQAEIVVTGSLIRRQDYVSQSPIVTVQSETLRQLGPAGTIDKGLSQLPQFTPTAGSGSAFPNRLGQALLNLRGLGANRMLILLNGRRVQPSAPDGSVDVNLLPAGLIQNVETITGGASAVYGSDAITGVVNFKLLDHYDGARITAQYNVPEEGAGTSFDVNLVAGQRFADDRGSLMVSLDYTQRGDFRASEHPFYNVSRTNGVIPATVVNFGATPPSQAAVNTVFGRYGIAAGSVSAARPIGANYDGTLFQSGPVINYKGPLNQDIIVLNNTLTFSAGRVYALQVPLKRYNAFARGDYDFGGVKVYGSLLYNDSNAKVNLSTIGLGQIASANGVVPVTNPFIPADLRTLLASRSTPNANFNVSYLFSSLPPVQFRTKGKEYQAALGADGEFGGSWTWSLYGSYGRTTTDQRIRGFSLAAAERLLMATDGGASLCQGGLNIFAPPSAISQSCIDYIANAGTTFSSFNQGVADATVQGDLFTLPAGALKVVLGADYRHNSFRSTPSANFIAGDVIPQGVILPARGKQGVREAFAEALVPVLKDVAFVQSLNVDLGYRYSDYSTFGGVSTYKADVDMTMFRALTLRGGYSHAIRAPSLADLYTPASLTSVTVGTPGANNKSGDPCDVRSSYRLGADAAKVRALCLAQGVPNSIIDTYIFNSSNLFPTSIGNPNLDPETANTYTVGLVLRSPFATPLLSQFQASVDYYNIKVRNAIGTVPFLTAVQNCFNADGISNPSFTNDNIFCGGIVRNALGQITQDSKSQTLNLAAYKTEGIDFQADWKIGLDALGLGAGAGSLTLNFVGTRLRKFIVQTYQSAPALDYAGATQGSITVSVLPKWKSVTSLTYSLGKADVGLRWRYIGPVKDVTRVTTVGSTVPGVGSVSYFDLNARLRVDAGANQLEFRGGVSNLFNRGIPQVSLTPGTTDPTTYDVIGRTYYLSASVKF